jgi:hypothetical protein
MEISIMLRRISVHKFAIIVGMVAICSVLVVLMSSIFIIGPHWSEIFRPATLLLLSGQSPYLNPRFFNPPWALIPLIPFALMPPTLGNAFICLLTLLSFGFVVYKMGGKASVIILFLLLPQTLYNLSQVNVDWLVALGFLMPPQIGLFFILIKPQLGVFLALFWLIEAWRKGQIREVARIFGPVSFAFLLSFLIFGPYLQNASFMVEYPGTSFWPLSIPVGLALLIISIRSRKPGLSIACAPLLTPYIMPYSLPVAILGLLPDQLITQVAIIGLYLTMAAPRYWYIFTGLLRLIHFPV